MPRLAFLPFLVALAAAAAGPGARPAFAVEDAGSGKDDLAEGDWHGGKRWFHLEGGDAGVDPPVPTTVTPPPSRGVATPPCNTGEPDGGCVLAGPPEPGEPGEPGDGDGDGPASPSPSPAGDPEGPVGPVAPPSGPSYPPSAPPILTPEVLTCNARWVCEVVEALPTLYESETMLTVTLFRTDAFAFVGNAYCRSESTWFVDAWATTRAGHDGLSQFRVDVWLEHPCPYCQPKIDLKGISQLLARAQVKTSWGGLDASTTAASSASSTWAGDIDCGDRCAASAADGQSTGEISVGADPLKITKTTTKDFVFVSAEGGKGAGNRISEERTSLLVMDRAHVSTFASGTDDNAQAKAQAGYSLVIHGESACGAWGEFEVVLEK